MYNENIHKTRISKRNYMKKTLLISLLSFICYLATHAQIVYVDCEIGDDNNSGIKESPVNSIHKAMEIIRSKDNNTYIMKINPGIYVLENHISVATAKDMTDKRIIIEASVLPDDSLWTPEKMPVIICTAPKGEIENKNYWIVSFLIDESHVTIRGIKFGGYFYPNSRYFPIARLNKTKTDLLVEQCLFVGETEGSPIQVGIIANGNEIKIDHCIFYKVRNTVVFLEPSEDNGINNDNSITNSIIFGVNQAVWTNSPDNNFKFENNIVSNCRYVWVKRVSNSTIYSINNCLIVNNKYYTGIPDDIPIPLSREKKLQLSLKPGKFEINEKNVIKEGQVLLRLADSEDMALLFGIDEPLPKDYMHPIPGTPGYNTGAGLFEKREF
jgi:hypothetical protein